MGFIKNKIESLKFPRCPFCKKHLVPRMNVTVIHIGESKNLVWSCYCIESKSFEVVGCKIKN